MATDDGQPIVQRDIGLLTAAGDRAVGLEELLHQGTDQSAALVGAGRRLQGEIEAGGIPVPLHVAPIPPGPAVESLEKGRVAEGRAQSQGIVEQPLGAVHPGNSRLRVQGPHPLHIAPEHRRLHAHLADHVVRDQQEALPLQPGVVPGHHLRQPLLGLGGRMLLQQEVQHRHEVALARAEAAMQIGRLAAVGLHRPLDEVQGLVEVPRQLRGHHISAERLLRVGDALRQFEHEVAAVDALRQVDEVLDVGGHGAVRRCCY